MLSKKPGMVLNTQGITLSKSIKIFPRKMIPIINSVNNQSSFGDLNNKDSDISIKKLVHLPPLRLAKTNASNLVMIDLVSQEKDLTRRDTILFGGRLKEATNAE